MISTHHFFSFSLITILRRTLLELVTDSVGVIISVLDGVPRIRVDTQTVLTATTTPDGNWIHLLLTLENTTQGSISPSIQLSLYVDGVPEDTTELSNSFPTSISSAVSGSGYSGFLQDVGIYVPGLGENVTDPDTTEFIPQCFCYPEIINTANTSLCGSTQQNRCVLVMAICA